MACCAAIRFAFRYSMSSADILKAEFELLRQELIAKHDQLGMRATGKWAASLNFTFSGNSAELLQESYGEQLEYGRKPGKQPPSEAIEQWLVAKGIAGRLEGDISVSSLAYLIARKIGREGWDRKENGGTALISSVVTPERIQQIIDKVGESHLESFASEISSYFETLSA